ncbi:hypothetical protein F0344_03495 [Streptomyces finlayi]|uniref:Uncharacterized protein n=1 Tax=Streptomyces finlayi TaxID=67296 RepID=A0A7G7BEM9_9ACTN|nr:hypothetical protein F0344_03495 [Streptomyces finlayi]
MFRRAYDPSPAVYHAWSQPMSGERTRGARVRCRTSDIDEDDPLTWFGEDPSTTCIAIHVEDLKDGRGLRG